jgi:hypothetical protein
VDDLAIAKYVAGREKDVEFTRALARHGMTDADTLRQRLAQTQLDSAVRTLIQDRISADFSPA